MKVLVSAYACEPDKGSEPGIGWNHVKQIARFHEVWAITRANNRAAIERALDKEPSVNVHWIYFDLPRWGRLWKKGQRGVRAYYYLWQMGAYFLAKKLHREVGFELVNHVTLGAYWMPSFVSLLRAPFVWGPVGGGESAPKAFRRSFGVRGRIYETLRDLARHLSRFNPFVRLTARRATVALATTYETERELRRLQCRNVSIFPGAALPEQEICRLGQIALRRGDHLRLVSVGRLLHWKGFELAVRAFAQVRGTGAEAEYWIIGNGPEKRRLESVARRLGVGNCVQFWGDLSRREVLAKLADCDVLVHPSLHDSSGWACLEAMAAGRPVVCLDLGGPAIQVSNQTGIKIPANSPEQVIADLARAFERLAGDGALRAALSKAARTRVQQEFSWKRHGDRLQSVYDQVAVLTSEALGDSVRTRPKTPQDGRALDFSASRKTL
jgi:glycosyltransferase involved in cell wall biosynthesis